MLTKKIILLFFVLICGILCIPAKTTIGKMPERINISDNRHYLVDEQGHPFFYLADTAWELFHRLSREEADMYLKDRARKGFTVIQAVAIAELDGINTPNTYGHLPFIEEDPTRPAIREGTDNDYWDHVDYIIRRANEQGLYMAILPTWGRYWHDGSNPIFNTQNVRIYGRWLASRYRDAKVIWVLGGDRNPENNEQREIIRQMARGLIEGDQHTHLITYHPTGFCGSAQFFHNEDWLDFNKLEKRYNSKVEKNEYDNEILTIYPKDGSEVTNEFLQELVCFVDMIIFYFQFTLYLQNITFVRF